MNENENLVAEATETVETANVETANVETATEPTPEKKYTQDEVNSLMGRRVARERARVEREYKEKYGELEDVLKAGMKKEDLVEITRDLRNFYSKQKGVEIPQKAKYSAEDIETLARAEAAEIIRGGYEEVVEETDRLAKVGVANMSARDKAVFRVLAEHRRSAERSRELNEIGVTEEVYNSSEFKEFQGMFKEDTPISKVFEQYQKSKPKKEFHTMGSMKQSQDSGVKDYYTPEEIARLTEEDLDDPKVWEAVRRSMTGR